MKISFLIIATILFGSSLFGIGAFANSEGKIFILKTCAQQSYDQVILDKALIGKAQIECGKHMLEVRAESNAYPTGLKTRNVFTGYGWVPVQFVCGQQSFSCVPQRSRYRD